MRRVRFKSANERSKGEVKEGKRRGRERKRKGKGEREIASEALAETEKMANAPAGNRTRDPRKRGWCSTIEPPRQATSPASLFKILSVLPLCDFFRFCHSFTSNFPFPLSLPLSFPSSSFPFLFLSLRPFVCALKSHSSHLSLERSFIFVLRKKGSKTKERMKEEEIEKGDCGPIIRKFSFQVQQNLEKRKDLFRPENAPC